jgi:hypothetical protein
VDPVVGTAYTCGFKDRPPPEPARVIRVIRAIRVVNEPETSKSMSPQLETYYGDSGA